MKQRDPQRRPPSLTPKNEKDIIRQVRHYKVITPLFGGGAIPQQPDEVTVIRASEIRGLLRFWWRATRGGQFDGSLEAMRKVEEAIWGSAGGKGKAGPSPIAIAVRVLQEGRPDIPFEVIRKKGKIRVQPRQGSIVPPYAAFSLQPKKEDAHVGMELPGVYVGVAFELIIHFPEAVRQEVEAALWAWETFGGVGARTRRGFGALQLGAIQENGQALKVDMPTCEQVKSWIHARLRSPHLSATQWPKNVPHLNLDMFDTFFHVTRRERNAIEVWTFLITKYQSFRQKRHKKFGLSLWPEANVIRTRMRKRPKWPDRVHNPQVVDKFPRGQFGLPIIFHMPHDNLGREDFTLQGKQGPDGKSVDRLASPLILKPLPCQSGYVGLVAVLDAPRKPPFGLFVPELPDGHQDAESKLTRRDANTEPLRRILHGEPDVLKAFLNFLKAQS